MIGFVFVHWVVGHMTMSDVATSNLALDIARNGYIAIYMDILHRIHNIIQHYTTGSES